MGVLHLLLIFMALQRKSRVKRGIMNMKLNGEISVKNIEVFYNNLAKEMDNSREIVIDLSDVTRIDLAATQVTIAAGKKARELKKVVRLIGVNPQVKKLLTLAGIKA